MKRGKVKAVFLQLIKLRGDHFRNLHFKGVRLGVILYTRSIFWRSRPLRLRTEIPERVRQYIQQYVVKEWGVLSYLVDVGMGGEGILYYYEFSLDFN